jgi:outer membrane lipoprotein SlyB
MYVRRREIPLLEEKVRVLMAKLDLAPKTATGVRGGSGDTSGDTVGGVGDGEVVGGGGAVAGAIAGEDVDTKG